MPLPLMKGYRLTAVALVGSALLLPLQPANAIDQINLNIGAVASSTWRAERLSLTLDWDSPTGTGYQLSIGKLDLAGLDQSFEGVTIDCRKGEVDGQRISCEQGEASLPYPLLDRSVMGLSFAWDRLSGGLSGKLRDVAVADGRLDLDFSLTGGDWRIGFQGKGLKLGALAGLWPGGKAELTDWEFAARLDLSGALSGRDERVLNGDWSGRLNGLSFADTGSVYVGEGLAAKVDGKLARAGDAWLIENRLELAEGELLTPGFYLDAGRHPLTLEGELSLDGAFKTLGMADLRLRLRDLLDLQLQGVLARSADQPVQRLSLQVRPVQAGDLYRETLQPVLAGTPWGRFEMAGEMELALRLNGETMSLDLGLTDFNLDDMPAEGATRRMGLYGLNGNLYWNRGGDVRPSRFQWQSGHLLEHVDIGPGRLDFQAADASFRLNRQTRVPVLDGFLVIDRLDVESLGTPAQKLQFDGLIEPISLAALSEALGWVPLSGKLSGMIPGLTYENGLFSIEGVLLARVFDGDVLISQLRTRDLFGVYPQLQADIELRNLDLEGLTNTFSFGKITGRLDGYVRALNLEDWRPVSFDAHFHTPEDDDSRRRISQKAVDNISNLGGAGLSGSLARTFMGLFEEFRYKRIGIGCRLQQGVCDMVGAGEARQGYYLVEGSGIPRIDIIGYNQTADWDSLLEQLKQISASDGPIVE